MEWVKSMKGYYRLFEIATGTDAMEVMFKRGDVLAGEIGQGGFIPDAMLPQLTRRPATAKKTADQLVKTNLWARVRGGYLIVDWAEHNAELVRLTERKKRDRERKRADRASARDVSVDDSTDTSVDSPRPRPEESLLDHKSESQRENAAAAKGPGLGADDLPPAVAILRAALEAHKLQVQWSNLNQAELDEIVGLVDVHGDMALVQSALRSYQPNKPPATAKAWLRQWRDLRAPGDLRVVTDPCPEPGHSGTTKHCTQCASEALVERKTP